MAAMHAVEIAERHGAALPGGRRRRASRRRPGSRRDDHAASRRGTSTMASPSITTLSPLQHWVFSVTRRRFSSIAVMVADGGDGVADHDRRQEVSVWDM